MTIFFQKHSSGIRNVACITVVGVSSTFLPPIHYLLEINANLSLYYIACELIIGWVICCCSSALSRVERNLIVSIFVVHLLWTIAIIAPFYKTRTAVLALNGQPVRILYANVETSNKLVDLLKRRIDEEHPDIVALVELDERWINDLSLESSYPFRIVKPRNDNFGLGVFSRFPLINGETTISEDVPTIWTRVQLVGGSNLNLSLVHYLPPISHEALEENSRISSALMAQARASTEAFIALGDFNATPFSAYYREIVRYGLMRDAFLGFGWHRTWDAKDIVTRLWLDHVFVNSQISIRDARVLEFIGSDHFPALVDVLLP